jgi:hypothetical protein
LGVPEIFCPSNIAGGVMAKPTKYEPMQFWARPHPSGRPIRQARCVSRPIWRIPDDGATVPRLRRREMMPAIGFTVGRLPGSDDEFE